jgi:hypothetical protein
MIELSQVLEPLLQGLLVIVFAAFCGVLWLARGELRKPR